MKKFNILSFLLTASLLTMMSCKENDINESDILDDADRQYELVGPLGHFTFSAREIINEFGDDDFIVNKDSLLMYSFKMPLEMEWDELISFTSPIISQNYTIPNSTASFTTSVSNTIKLQMNPTTDVRIDNATLAGGIININITVPAGITGGTLKVSFPEIKKSNIPLSFSFPITSSNHKFVIKESLANTSLTCIQGSTVAPYNSYITVVPTLSNLTGNTGGNMSLTGSISDINADQTVGYFGKKTVTKKDYAFEFDMYEKFGLEGMITFNDFPIYIQGINSIGTPFKLNVSNIRLSKKDKVGSEWILTEDNNTTKLSRDIDLLAASGPSPLIPDTTEYVTINKENSNSEKIGTLYPNYLQCDMSGTSNPTAGSNTSTISNFIGTDKSVKANLIVNFPIWFATSKTGYLRTDTIDFDFNDLFDEEESKSIEVFKLKFDFSSCMPFDIKAQARVVDENNVTISTLLGKDELIIEAAPPANDCKSVTAKNTTLNVSVSQEQFKKFRDKKAKKILLDLTMMTYDVDKQTMVKVYSTNNLSGKISFNIKSQIPN